MRPAAQRREAEKGKIREEGLMTSPGFQPQTFAFLKDLGGNNSKTWFEANKTSYQRYVKKPADALRSALEQGLAALTGREIVSKQFRINRDLRFSKDKTPYNTHIRMAFWPKGAVFEGKDAQPPSFFLSVEADHIRVGTGCMVFAKPVLGAWLKAIETGDGDDIAGLLSALKAGGFEVSSPDLANVPKGFPRDHPQGELARHKGLAVWRTLEDTGLILGEKAEASLLKTWKPALPLWKWLAALQEKA